MLQGQRCPKGPNSLWNAASGCMYTLTHSKRSREVSLSHDNSRHRLAGISFSLKKTVHTAIGSRIRPRILTSKKRARNDGWRNTRVMIDDYCCGTKRYTSSTPRVLAFEGRVQGKKVLLESQPACFAYFFQNWALTSFLPPADIIATRTHQAYCEHTRKAYETDDDSCYTPKKTPQINPFSV